MTRSSHASVSAPTMSRGAPRFVGARLWRGIVIAGCLGIAGCSEEPLRVQPMGLRQVPVDSVRPDEVPEGPLRFFGLAVPRGARVVKQSPKFVELYVRRQLEPVANFFRQRISEEKVSTGANRTVFRGAIPDAEPTRTVDIEVIMVFQGLRIVLHDKTRKRAPLEPDLSEKDRWGRMGLTPDGKVLDKYQQ